VDDYGYKPNPVATEAFIAATPAVYGDQIDNLPVDMEKTTLNYRHVAAQMRGSKWIQDGRLKGQSQGSLGSCVGFGTGGAVKITAACDIAMRKQPEGWPKENGVPIFPHCGWLYAAGRQVTNNLGRWQGSYGSAAAKAVEKMGTYWLQGKYDTYSASQTKGWQMGGVPQETKEYALEHKMSNTAVVTSFKHAVGLIQAGYGMNMCCGYAWNGRRDSDGFVRIDGRWAHSTTSGICYVCVPDTSYSGPSGARRHKRGIGNQNSWPNGWKSPSNGGGPLGSQTPDLPWQSWIIHEADYERCLSGRDTFAYGGFDGFLPPRAKWEDRVL